MIFKVLYCTHLKNKHRSLIIIFYRIRKTMNRKLSISAYLSIASVLLMMTEGNYVINGGFQNPTIDRDQYQTYRVIQKWEGYFDMIGPEFSSSLGFKTQSVDINPSANGFFVQNMSIPISGIFTLMYQTSGWYDTDQETFKHEIYWNDQLISTSTVYDTKIVTKQVIFKADKGQGRLKFLEVGDRLDNYGSLIDNICIEEFSIYACKIVQKIQINEKIKIFVSLLGLVSTTQLNIRFAGFFCDDLSLYIYDRRFYNSTIEEIFVIANEIEEIQWSLLNMASQVPIHKQMIPMSSLISFSNRKHMEADGVDDSFVRGIFPFAIFGITPILVTTFIFNIAFRCLFNYQISSYLRRFYFVLPCLLQSLIQSNVSFFTYLFFRQCFISFSFKVWDKMFIATALVFFFFVIIFSCCFYFLGNLYYKKKFGYFIYCFYRKYPSMIFLNFQIVMRGLVRGAIHSCLHNHYEIEIYLLCVMQASIILMAVVLQNKCQIFMTKLMFNLTVSYHFGFILLNIVLLAEEQSKKNGDSLEKILVFLFFQKCIIYSLCGITILQVILDFIPHSCFQKNKQKKQIEQNDKEKEGNSTAKQIAQLVQNGSSIKQRNIFQENDERKSNRSHKFIQEEPPNEQIKKRSQKKSKSKKKEEQKKDFEEEKQQKGNDKKEEIQRNRHKQDSRSKNGKMTNDKKKTGKIF